MPEKNSFMVEFLKLCASGLDTPLHFPTALSKEQALPSTSRNPFKFLCGAPPLTLYLFQLFLLLTVFKPFPSISSGLSSASLTSLAVGKGQEVPILRIPLPQPCSVAFSWLIHPSEPESALKTTVFFKSVSLVLRAIPCT